MFWKLCKHKVRGKLQCPAGRAFVQGPMRMRSHVKARTDNHTDAHTHTHASGQEAETATSSQ